MSFFCSVVLGEGKSKLVSECCQIALPQPVQSHCILSGGCDGFCNVLLYNPSLFDWSWKITKAQVQEFFLLFVFLLVSFSLTSIHILSCMSSIYHFGPG